MSKELTDHIPEKTMLDYFLGNYLGEPQEMQMHLGKCDYCHTKLKELRSAWDVALMEQEQIRREIALMQLRETLAEINDEKNDEQWWREILAQRRTSSRWESLKLWFKWWRWKIRQAVSKPNDIRIGDEAFSRNWLGVVCVPIPLRLVIISMSIIGTSLLWAGTQIPKFIPVIRGTPSQASATPKETRSLTSPTPSLVTSTDPIAPPLIVRSDMTVRLNDPRNDGEIQVSPATEELRITIHIPTGKTFAGKGYLRQYPTNDTITGEFNSLRNSNSVEFIIKKPTPIKNGLYTLVLRVKDGKKEKDATCGLTVKGR